MKTILLVDDEPALVEILTDLIQDKGYRVISAANGREGLSRLLEERADLVITDFMMPIADGRELVQAMQASSEFQHIPIVMMSATTRSVSLSTPKGPLTVSAFIRKPADWEQLLAVIVRLIGRGEKAPR
jgi:CheY-like chemotaxis protein